MLRASDRMDTGCQPEALHTQHPTYFTDSHCARRHMAQPNPRPLLGIWGSGRIPDRRAFLTSSGVVPSHPLYIQPPPPAYAASAYSLRLRSACRKGRACRPRRHGSLPLPSAQSKLPPMRDLLLMLLITTRTIMQKGWRCADESRKMKAGAASYALRAEQRQPFR